MTSRTRTLLAAALTTAGNRIAGNGYLAGALDLEEAREQRRGNLRAAQASTDPDSPGYRAGYRAGRRDGAQWATSQLVGITAGTTTLAVVLPEQAAIALRQHTPMRRNPAGPIDNCECGHLRLGASWAMHAIAQVFDALPTVPPRTDRQALPEPRQPTTASLLTADTRGAPITAAELVDQYEAEQRANVEPTRPGWTWLPASALTEWVGRQVRLPEDPGVPTEPCWLQRATRVNDTEADPGPFGDLPAGTILVQLAGHPMPFALLPDTRVEVHVSGH
jgi:hypothetical protein